MKKICLLLVTSLVLMHPSLSRAASDEGKTKKCAAIHQTPVAVFIQPSDSKIESMKKESGEDFDTIADDAMYYQWQATEFLEKMKFPYCFTENENHVFKAGQNKEYSVNEKCEGWCLVLWNGKDKPISSYAIDISMQEEYLRRDTRFNAE